MTDSIARVSAADCGPSTKIMRIEKYAFVPDVQYMCCSQPVVVYNVSGRYMSFTYKVLYGRTTSESNLRSGSYIWLYSPTSIYNVRYYYNREYTYLTDEEVKSGTGPDSH